MQQTIATLPGCTNTSPSIPVLGQLVRRVPGYVLEAGTDLDQIGEAFRRLLAEASRGGLVMV